MDWRVLVILIVSTIGFCCSEIIENGDFESELDETNWLCFSCTLERDEDAFGGVYSGKVTNRYIHYWLVSVSYFIFLKKHSSYLFLHQVNDKMLGVTLTWCVTYLSIF